MSYHVRHSWQPVEFRKGKGKIPVRFKCCCGVEKVEVIGSITQSYTYYVMPGKPNDHLSTAPSCTGPRNQASLFSSQSQFTV